MTMMLMIKSAFVAALCLLASNKGIVALDNGVGLVPPMGWNSWNAFHCNIDQDTIKTAALQLQQLGLDKLGYRYVNLDDCWMAHERTKEGKYVGDPQKFSMGMAALGDWLHERDLFFGIYTSAGTHTCAGYPGALGHERVDAATFASWGVDYLKYDNCYAEHIPSIQRYTPMRDALNATGRHIFYSLCQWGTEDSWHWAPQVGNSWRTTTDIVPTWSSIKFNFQASQDLARASAGLGSWLDPDMLEVGNGDLTEEENKSHFALWCLAKSPLLLGMDLSQISNSTLKIISHRPLIELHQNVDTQQAKCHVGCTHDSDWSMYVMTRPVTTSEKETMIVGPVVIALLVNWADTAIESQSYNLADFVGIVPTPTQVVTMTDLWTLKVYRKDLKLGGLESLLLPAMGPHESLLYEFKTQQKSTSAFYYKKKNKKNWLRTTTKQKIEG